MKLSSRSKAWMQEHLNDEYVKRAQKEGYRARAAYKLIEIDDKDKLIKPGMTVVDLGCAPGSWAQVVKQLLEEKLNNKPVDLVIADMAPNMSGVKDADQAGAAYLTELALEFSQDWLKPKGNFLVKVFIGSGFDEIVKRMRSEFDKVVTRKPKASRGRSSEVYLLGLGRKK